MTGRCGAVFTWNSSRCRWRAHQECDVSLRGPGSAPFPGDGSSSCASSSCSSWVVVRSCLGSDHGTPERLDLKAELSSGAAWMMTPVAELRTRRQPAEAITRPFGGLTSPGGARRAASPDPSWIRIQRLRGRWGNDDGCLGWNIFPIAGQSLSCAQIVSATGRTGGMSPRRVRLMGGRPVQRRRDTAARDGSRWKIAPQSWYTAASSVTPERSGAPTGVPCGEVAEWLKAAVLKTARR